MGKRKVLTNFDKNQLVMAKQLVQSISKTAGLCGGVSGMQWLVESKSGPRKDNDLLGNLWVLALMWMLL